MPQFLGCRMQGVAWLACAQRSLQQGSKSKVALHSNETLSWPCPVWIPCTINFDVPNVLGQCASSPPQRLPSCKIMPDRQVRRTNARRESQGKAEQSKAQERKAKRSPAVLQFPQNHHSTIQTHKASKTLQQKGRSWAISHRCVSSAL